MSETPRQDSNTGRPCRAHEPADVNTRHVVLAGAFLLAMMGIGIAIVTVLAVFTGFDRPVSREPTEIPPEPRLLPHPELLITQLKSQETEQLHSYGWVNKEKRIVRIPIHRAMELVAKQDQDNRDRP